MNVDIDHNIYCLGNLIFYKDRLELRWFDLQCGMNENNIEDEIEIQKQATVESCIALQRLKNAELSNPEDLTEEQLLIIFINENNATLVNNEQESEK